MTPEERAAELWESWLADVVDDDQRMRADVASAIRAAEEEAWNRALDAAERSVAAIPVPKPGPKRVMRADAVVVIRSLKSPLSAPGGTR